MKVSKRVKKSVKRWRRQWRKITRRYAKQLKPIKKWLKHSDHQPPTALAFPLVLLCCLVLALALSSDLFGLDNFIQPARVEHNAPTIVKPKHIKISEPVQPGINCMQVACLALTFDDGPNPLTTPQIVSELEQANVKATFFMVGSRVAGNDGLLQQMYNDGDEIGNHSWSHPDLTKLPVDQIRQQVKLTQEAIMAAGVPPPTLFRPPYGAVNPTIEANIPMTILLWNEDPEDWAARTPAQVVRAVEASAHPGGIVDMHDIYDLTANALPQILSDLQAQGYHFVTVSELLKLTPASRGLYYGHY
ncbi:MAG TPA: polysaccharide deacetylase family protein [Candidatus Saccharimonadales bacterium]|nr:polysaccharide deacetylase family protein [Candidatus Saccharimonadales bacterium]